MKTGTVWSLVACLSSFMIIVFACASTPKTVSEKEAAATATPTDEVPGRARKAPQKAPWKFQEPVRIPPLEAYQKAKSGKALLVCAYEDETICEVMHLEGAIFLQDLEAKLPTLPNDQEIIFYCH